MNIIDFVDTTLGVLEVGRWRYMKCLEPGTMLLVAWDGAYRPMGEDEVIERREMEYSE